MGSRDVAAGANPSFVSGRGQGTPWTSHQLITGHSLMSNVGFSILLKDTSTCSSALPGAGIWTSNLPIASRPALPTELQPARIHMCEGLMVKYVMFCVQCLQMISCDILMFYGHFRIDVLLIVCSWCVCLEMFKVMTVMCSSPRMVNYSIPIAVVAAIHQPRVTVSV